jgi:hypothetical protein
MTNIEADEITGDYIHRITYPSISWLVDELSSEEHVDIYDMTCRKYRDCTGHAEQFAFELSVEPSGASV